MTSICAPLLLALAAVWLMAGCNGDAPDAPCTPGRSIECSGPWACEGAQICLADGSGYGPCECVCAADLQRDPLHCGACFNPCAPNQTCEAGTCTCQADPAPPSFSGDLLPLFAASCTSGLCHHAGGPKSVSLLPEEAYADLVNVPATRCDEPRLRVVPGEPHASHLIDRMLGVRLCGGFPMPLEELLPPEQIATVARWICAGALDD